MKVEARDMSEDPIQQESGGTGLKVTIKNWNGVASWKWVANDDTCGICRVRAMTDIFFPLSKFLLNTIFRLLLTAVVRTASCLEMIGE